MLLPTAAPAQAPSPGPPMHLAQNAWFVVLPSAELPSARAHTARRLGQDLVFWRDQSGHPHAALDVCPHRGASFARARTPGGALECPFHGHRFDGTGACTAVPAHPGRPISGAMSLSTLPVREAHGFVWLWTGPDPAPTAPIPFFDFTGFTWTGSATTIPLPIHHTRAVENQLDFAHLPFVHRHTIGRMVPSPAVDLRLSVDGDLIHAGTPEDPDFIQFRAPATWRNRTGPTWQFLAFVPVDDQRSLVYLRSYQPWVQLPPLAWLLGQLSRLMNLVIFREDKAVVATQPNVETRLRMGEVLLPSDGAIIAYRRWREARRTPFAPEPPPAAAQRRPSSASTTRASSAPASAEPSAEKCVASPQ